MVQIFFSCFLVKPRIHKIKRRDGLYPIQKIRSCIDDIYSGETVDKNRKILKILIACVLYFLVFCDEAVVIKREEEGCILLIRLRL